ncbi:flavodoxin [Ammoniphilus sp. CFH 90114]|uniref:flavodoxin n=1 Tax=Ammoniphilus sp. CFH 90114 TaxID=2493665 RepID=UPI00101005AA|nr:flavodoxin [Ammoniphilus sp. CFH 90114]RXT05239.1 flavodoxin [Ammoniphilus sp. CFH 90114]
MNKVLLVFASMSGNTEGIAHLVAEGIKQAGKEVDIKEIFDATAKDLLEYDGIILGAYTWGDGELPDDFLDFYDDMDATNLTGKKAAVFGSGDHAYLHFCAAVDILENKLQECGAELVQEGLKIEMSPTSAEEEQCKDFGRKFAAQLLSIG